MNSFCHWLSAILVVTWDHAGVASGGATRMQFGEAAVPVSCFVEKVGPVFQSRTSNMLIFWIALSSCLHLLRKEFRSAGVSNTLSLIQLLWRRDHQPSVQVIFTNFFRRTGALFHTSSTSRSTPLGTAYLALGPSAVCKVNHSVHADHVVLLVCSFGRS